VGGKKKERKKKALKNPEGKVPGVCKPILGSGTEDGQRRD